MSSLTPVAVLHGTIAIASGGGEPVLEDVTVKSGSTQQTVTAGEGYDAIGEVTVEPITLQNKTVTPSGSQQTVTADTGYDGLGTVTVEAASSLIDFAVSSNASNDNTISDIFRDCTWLKSFDVNGKSGYIFASSCFDGCTNLEFVKCGNANSIGSDCFYGCSKLTDLYVGYRQGMPEAVSLSGRWTVRDIARIHVPADMVETYQAATNWSDYANKIVGDYNV